MNILIVSQYFWPENFRINDLAVGLVELGNEVTVLTGIPNYPEGRYFAGYDIFRNTSQEYHGVKVVRVPLFPRGAGGRGRLGLNVLSFIVSGCLFAPLRCRGKYDLIFVFEPSPVTVALPALFLKALRQVPVIFWVQDLWPESLAATGAVTSRRILDGVAHVVRFIYRRCDRILVPSEAFRASVEKYSGNPGNVRYFPQSAEDVFGSIVEKKAMAIFDSIPKGFWLMFAGNIGAAQDFPTIIAAAEKLSAYRDIHWIIAGDGRMCEWAKAEIVSRGLTHNFHFLGRHPLEAMPQFFSHADAMLVTLKKEPIFALTVPAKIQSYLASSRPIIAALDGEGAKIIEEAGAGYTCPTEDADGLSAAVLRMYGTLEPDRERMGLMGRAYYEAHFDKDMLVGKLVCWMQELVATNKRKKAST